MAGTDGSFESPETELLRVESIQGFFGTYDGRPGALISLVITAKPESGAACTGTNCQWNIQGGFHGSHTSSPSVTISSGQHLIGWDQTLDDTRTTLLGVNLHVYEIATSSVNIV